MTEELTEDDLRAVTVAESTMRLVPEPLVRFGERPDARALASGVEDGSAPDLPAITSR